LEGQDLLSHHDEDLLSHHDEDLEGQDLPKHDDEDLQTHHDLPKHDDEDLEGHDLEEKENEAAENSVMDGPPSLGTGVLRWESVNIETIENALELDAVRRLRLDYYNTFQVLLSISRRVVNVRGKIGMIAVLERESEPVAQHPQRL
jgi:hypothetical protein